MALDPFARAETRYSQLREARGRGAYDARSFRTAVRELGVTDGEGREWMLGPQDGNWYRRERDRWLPAEPPRRLVCQRCHHANLTRHAFCVQCGTQLDRTV